ncbi:hypothetical protein MNBD_ALPHA07-2426 [hydrothermal vent metagenome]|uniref:Uncharacterized protein n=1 Tax=hydrothermal vent metagenome TaxID=652676 RepID=A0A3B0RB05_9ZZZZ
MIKQFDSLAGLMVAFPSVVESKSPSFRIASHSGLPAYSEKNCPARR